MSDSGFEAGFQRHLDIDPVVAVTRESYEDRQPPPAPTRGNVVSQLPKAGDGWLTEAACRSAHTDLWFNESTYPEARKICQGCPVRRPCLEYALEHHETHGMWGGLSWRQRKAEARKRRAA